MNGSSRKMLHRPQQREKERMTALPGATGATHATALQALAYHVREAYRTYVAFHSDLEKAESGTLALWTFHTWVYDVAEVTPYLMITAPTSSAGKSRIFDVARLLVREPFPVVDPSPAALYRTIDALRPTVLIDEADMITQSAKLRSVLNSGFAAGGFVPRTGRDGTSLEMFETFCPKAFAGIAHGRQPITAATLTRCIQIPMRRRAEHEEIRKFRRREAQDVTAPLRHGLQKWALQARLHLDGARPVMPDGLEGRQENAWEPLIAIADMIGKVWGREARGWAEQLTQAIPHEPDVGVQLLLDVRRVLDNWPRNRIATRDLAKAIRKLEDREYEDDLNPLQLGRRLAGFGLHPEKWREEGGEKRGFTFRRGGQYRPAWADAFSRYGV